MWGNTVFSLRGRSNGEKEPVGSEVRDGSGWVPKAPKGHTPHLESHWSPLWDALHLYLETLESPSCTKEENREDHSLEFSAPTLFPPATWLWLQGEAHVLRGALWLGLRIWLLRPCQSSLQAPR